MHGTFRRLIILALCCLPFAYSPLGAATVAEGWSKSSHSFSGSKFSATIVKPEGLFVAKNASHPHAALLFVEWVLSREAQSFLATTLGKGSAMKGVRSKYREFAPRPDFVVSPKLGASLQAYIQDFRKVMNAP